MSSNINVQPRQLGSGFGPNNQFPIFLNEPNRGLVNGALPSDKIAVMHDWIEGHQKGKRITDILDGRIIARVLPDILFDISVTHLAKILPRLMADLPPSIRELFLNENLLNKLDERFLNSLKKSLPAELPEGVTTAYLTELLTSKSLNGMAKDPLPDNAYVVAYLIPALLDLMQDEDLEKAAVKIAQRLAPKEFKAVAEADYFDLNLESHEHAITVENNGRTLIFRARTEGREPSLAKYRGHLWSLDHTHLHLERDGEEREYVLFNSPEQKKEVDAKKIRDPNLDFVGEIHTVYKRMPKKYAKLEPDKQKNYWKYMAVAVPLKIGAFNQDFQDVLDKLNQEGKLTENKEIKDFSKNFQEMFLRKFESSSVLYHNWGSLKSPTWGFRSGLSFNIIPSSITISDTQYNHLKTLFGNLDPLPEAKVLEPIDRRAGRRQIRAL